MNDAMETSFCLGDSRQLDIRPAARLQRRLLDDCQYGLIQVAKEEVRLTVVLSVGIGGSGLVHSVDLSTRSLGLLGCTTGYMTGQSL